MPRTKTPCLQQAGLMNRREIEALYGISYATVMNYCRQEVFGEEKKHPDAPGSIYYDMNVVLEHHKHWRKWRHTDERPLVENPADTLRAQLAADVFRLAKEGKDYVDIVIELVADPVTVRKLLEEYERKPGHDARMTAEQQARSLQLEVERDRRKLDSRLKHTDVYFDRKTELAKVEAKVKEKARTEVGPRPRIGLSGKD